VDSKEGLYVENAVRNENWKNSLSNEYSTSISSTNRNPVSRDSSVGIATSYWLDDRGVGVQVPVGSRIFTSLWRSDRLWGTLISYPMGTGGSFPGGKAAGA
jgi:hypothetical protein